MIKEAIRDNHSDQKVKPRVMDYIRSDSGEEILEVKDGRTKRTIRLSDLTRQIENIRDIHSNLPSHGSV